MIVVDIALTLVALSMLAAAYRVVRGPRDADRAVASDLLFFGFIGLIVLIGVRVASSVVFDLALVATVIGFLATLSLARLLTRGKR